MTHQMNDTVPEDVVELLIEQGPDGLARALTLIINAAMRVERERHLNAKPYERTVGKNNLCEWV